MMKKMIVMMMMVTLLIACTGCDSTSVNHAKVSFYSESVNGNQLSYCGDGILGYTGQMNATRNPTELLLKEGETLYLTFECDECENKQEFEIKDDWAKIISCDCEGKNKEYYSISVHFTEDGNEEATTETAETTESSN